MYDKSVLQYCMNIKNDDPYRVHESKDEYFNAQKDPQPSQTCSGGFIKTQLYAFCCCFFAIGEYNLI
jgi:hypothetical protein